MQTPHTFGGSTPVREKYSNACFQSNLPHSIFMKTSCNLLTLQNPEPVSRGPRERSIKESDNLCLASIRVLHKKPEPFFSMYSLRLCCELVRILCSPNTPTHTSHGHERLPYASVSGEISMHLLCSLQRWCSISILPKMI